MASKCDGESEKGCEMSYDFIHEAFVSNLAKVDELKRRMVESDLIDIHTIP